MNKKKLITISIIAFFLLSAGIIAVTQESPAYADGEYFIDLDLEKEITFGTEDEMEVPPYYGYIYLKEIPQWVKPVRWFKSNEGGLAIEELPSRITALRYEYALSVDYTQKEDLPGELLPFYNDDFLIEARTLYNKRNPVKTQWVFRDYSGAVMLIAVFSQDDDRSGFIEVYDENGYLSFEYNYFYDNENNKIDYFFNNNFLESSRVSYWKEIKIPKNSGQSEDERKEFAEVIEYDITGEYETAYIDTFYYNRSMFLRMIERTYYTDGVLLIKEEPVRVSLPSSVKQAQENKFSSGARYNALPEYFGAAFVREDYKMVYTTDDRNRILTQTLYDNEKIIWVITNTWQQDRISASVKTEGDIVLTAEYEYNFAGEKILERNFRNGNLERLVRVNDKTETEELYIDNVIVLIAVWEDGRKISETRIRNN